MEHAGAPNILVFDTECTSLFGSVIQLAFVIVDPYGNELHAESKYLRLTDGETIDPEAEKVHHITENYLSTYGCDPKQEIECFLRLCQVTKQKHGCIVAHNSDFDVDRINTTAVRCGMDARLYKQHVFCTMKNSAAKCNIRTYGRVKYPKNEELYEKLFGEAPIGPLHDALTDCRITMKSYIKGRELLWW